MSNKTILVTGAAGFIGYHLCERLLELGFKVIGLDNVNAYYNVDLKFARLANLGISRQEAENYNTIAESTLHGSRMQFIRMDLEDRTELPKLFKTHRFDLVCNLAAQAGVRYSLVNPEAYVDSNVVGFLNLLECCRHNQVNKLVFASSSSVYGNSDAVPFKETDNVDNPISLYAATKKSNELMAYTYSHLYGIETIGLRFFTVYGPWGRPDMAMYLFTNAIINDQPIKVFNQGDLSRDFTYIDDIVEGVCKTLLKDTKDEAKYRLYNIGNSKPVKLLDFIEAIEQCLNKKAIKNMMPMQAGDVYKTWADTSKLDNAYHYQPNTSVKEGVERYVEWYRGYFHNLE